MIERRVCASPTRRAPSIQSPASSGPRCCWLSRKRSNAALSTDSPTPRTTIPAIPHITTEDSVRSEGARRCRLARDARPATPSLPIRSPTRSTTTPRHLSGADGDRRSADRGAQAHLRDRRLATSTRTMRCGSHTIRCTASGSRFDHEPTSDGTNATTGRSGSGPSSRAGTPGNLPLETFRVPGPMRHRTRSPGQ